MKKRQRNMPTPEGDILRWIRSTYLGGARQLDLAEKLGVSLSYLANLEAGSTNLSEEKAREISALVSNTPEDELVILRKFQEAMIRRKMPEVLGELESRRFLKRDSEESPCAWSAWAEEVRHCMGERNISVDMLSEQTQEDAHYLKRLLSGEIMPSRHEVRTLAMALNQDVGQLMLMAGYLSDEGLEIRTEIGRLIEIQKRNEAKTTAIVKAVLEQAVEEED